MVVVVLHIFPLPVITILLLVNRHVTKMVNYHVLSRFSRAAAVVYTILYTKYIQSHTVNYVEATLGERLDLFILLKIEHNFWEGIHSSSFRIYTGQDKMAVSICHCEEVVSFCKFPVSIYIGARTYPKLIITR